MTTNERATVVGVFPDRRQAQEALHALRHAGFREDQLGVISPGDHNDPSLDQATGSRLAEGSAIGAAAGAGAGALWALGIAAGALPVIGPAVAGGLLISVLASAGGAAVAGTLVGGLIGLGIPEEEAAYFENEVKGGRTLVTVKAEGRADEAWSILRRFGAHDRHTGAAHPAGAATATHSAGAAGGTVQVHEEQLRAHKVPVQTGEVRVHKDVVTENKTINVPVTREEVVVERRPASGQASSADLRGEEIRIPVKEEQVRVEKETVVREEVSVGKRTVTENQPVSGTVRKEQVRVEREGDVDVRDRTGPNG